MELGLHDRKPLELADANLLILGRRDTGKTTLAVKLALDKIHGNESVVFLDSTGDAIEELLDHIPKRRQKDVILCDPSRSAFPLNIFSNVPPERYTTVASTLRDAVRSLWGFKISTANIDQYMKAGVLTVLPCKGESLLSLKYVITDQAYRQKLLKDNPDMLLKDFWKDHEALKDNEQHNRTASTLSKIWAFALEPKIRRCIDHRDNRLQFKDKIVLVSLKEADLGADNAALLGAIVLTSLYIEGLSDLTTTLFLDPAKLFLPLVPQLHTCRNITTILTLQALQETDVLPGVSKIVAFRTTLKDAKTLKDDFPVGESATKQLPQLADGVALLSGLEVLDIQTYPHDFPKTTERNKIEARCKSQSRLPDEAIDKRLERFTYVPKKDKPFRRRRRSTNP